MENDELRAVIERDFGQIVGPVDRVVKVGGTESYAFEVMPSPQREADLEALRAEVADLKIRADANAALREKLEHALGYLLEDLHVWHFHNHDPAQICSRLREIGMRAGLQ